MVNLDKFLKEWKTLETTMRANGYEVRDWEEMHVGELEAEQLKVCRIIRNYITHNPTEDFISRVDNTMIKWIKQFTKKLKAKKKTTRKSKAIKKDTNKTTKKLSKTTKKVTKKSSAKNKKKVIKKSRKK